jgi:hypothetical protein
VAAAGRAEELTNCGQENLTWKVAEYKATAPHRRVAHRADPAAEQAAAPAHPHAAEGARAPAPLVAPAAATVSVAVGQELALRCQLCSGKASRATCHGTAATTAACSTKKSGHECCRHTCRGKSRLGEVEKPVGLSNGNSR